MKDAILIELARRWKQDAISPQTESGDPAHREMNAVRQGRREAKRECADAILSLVEILGDGDAPVRGGAIAGVAGTAYQAEDKSGRVG